MKEKELEDKELKVFKKMVYDNDQINLIRKTVAKGATEEELKIFLDVCKKYDLDPFIKEIWFIKRPRKVKKSNNLWDYQRLTNGEIDLSNAETIIMTSRDGYLKIAQRDENFEGIVGFVVREGDDFEIDAEKYKVSHKFGSKRGNIIGAWSKVDHKKRKPVIVYADFREYYVETSSTWKQYPSAMILKVAEVLGLKRQFGISGLVTKEEMHIEEKEEFSKYQKNNSIIDYKEKEYATQEQKKILYSKAKDVGLSNSEYKKICYDLYTDGKITSESSTYWTDTDIEIIEASLIRNENINDLENVTN